MSSRVASLSLSKGLPWLAAALVSAAGAFPQLSGCAAADEELGSGGLTATGATSSTSTTSGTTTTTSGTGSSGTGTGTGSTTTATSSTGEGGATSSTSSTGQGGAGGAGGAGAGGGGAGGAAGTGTVLLLAGGGPSVLGGEFHTGAGWTTTTVAGGATDKGPALVMDATGQGVGVVRSTANAGELRATAWSAGAWSALAPVAMGVTTRDTPHAVAIGSAAFVVFHGDDFKHYLAVHDGAQWSPTAEPVGGAGPAQSFGPSPAAIGAAGASPVLAFAGNDHDLYDQTRSGGVWGPGIGHALGDLVDLTPAIAAPTTGPNLMIVLVRKTDSALLYTVRNGVNWTMPIAIANTSSTAAPALLALPAGELLLAYRGPANKLFTSRYTPGSVPPWSAPAQLGMDTLASAPALAPGVDGALAELAYVDAGTGAAFHARLTGAAWSAPALVGGAGMSDVALASAP